jgi:hypothetical protein
MSLDAAALSGAEMQAYEERFLFLLLLLRQPRAEIIYVTSQPIHPSVIDLRGLPPLPPGAGECEGSPLALRQRRPWAKATLREAAAGGGEGKTGVCYADSQGERMKRNALIAAGLIALAFAAAFPPTTLAAPEKSASAAQLEVTYYYLPT